MLHINSIETMGTHEGPGLRFVIFTQGCNIRCVYCHNPETWCVKGGKQVTQKSLIEQALRQKSYFKRRGGVTVSGGEPLLQAKDLIRFFKKLKEEGIHTCIDTNGSILNEDVCELLKYTDLVLLDIKHMDSDYYRKVTGSKYVDPMMFIDELKKLNISFWVRYVLVPNFTDHMDSIELMGQELSKYDNLQRLEILPYHTLGSGKYEKLKIDNGHDKLNVPSKESVQEIKQILLKYIKHVYVR